MINLKVNDADRILIVEMKGMITEADIDGAIDALQEQYPAVGIHLRGGERGFNILADWQELQGWEKGAKTLGTLTTKTIGDTVRKVAVIASAAFADEQPRLADVAKQAVVRYFPPGGRDDALAWLRSIPDNFRNSEPLGTDQEMSGVVCSLSRRQRRDILAERLRSRR